MKYIKIESCLACLYSSIDFSTKDSVSVCYHHNINSGIGRIIHNENTIADFCPLPDLPRWISVKERLPEEPGYYQCWDIPYSSSMKNAVAGFFDGKTWSTGIAEDYSNVTHWMPYPKGPEGE